MLIALGCAAAAAPLAAPIEPPPEAEPGADFVAESRDSMPDGDVEVAWDARGRAGRAGYSRQQNVRFHAGSLEGDLREGGPEALGAGELTANRAGRGWTVGRLAPRWGNGLLLGAPAEPWSGRPADRGPRSALRGRAGDGVHWRRRLGAVGVETLAGTFASRKLAGARLSLGGREGGRGGSLLGVGARRGGPQGGIALFAGGSALEWAGDRRGRWRAEVSLEEERGPWRLAPRARLGHPGFRSLAEPRRAGPARLLSLAATRDWGAVQLAAAAAQWQWMRGRAGSRVALEARSRIGADAPLEVGWEERQGPQRVTASSSPRRQAWWGELGAGGKPVALRVRHDRAGQGAWGARASHEATTLAAGGGGRWGIRWQATHTVYRSRGGEGFYALEREPGRLVTRALAGRGLRTTVRLIVPSGRNRWELQVNVAEARGKPTRLEWQARWAARGRVKPGVPTP